MYNKNTLTDMGISIINRQNQRSFRDIGYRDINMLFTNINCIEPRKNCIILTLATVYCLIQPNQLIFVVSENTRRLVQYLMNNEQLFQSTVDFELTSLELILDFIIEEFTAKFDIYSLQLDNLEKQGNRKYIQIIEQQMNILALNNDITLIIDSIDSLLDDDDDVLALSFRNQKLMKNFVQKSKRTQQQVSDSKQSSKVQSQQEFSGSVFSVYEYENEPIKYVHEVPVLSLFLQRNLYQLNNIQVESGNYYKKAQNIIKVEKIKQNTLRDQYLKMQAYFEIVCTSICIMNTIAVIFGSNLNNPWYPTEEYKDETSFWLITALILLIGIIYIIINSIIFTKDYNKLF